MKYYEFYSTHLTFEGDIKDGDNWTACKCPLHNDSNASAGVNLEHGTFNCYVCGAFSPERFLSKLTGMPFVEAAGIADEYRRNSAIIIRVDTFVNHRVTNPRWDELVIQSSKADLSKIPLALDYAESRGLTIDTLKERNVGYLKAEYTNWKRDSLVFPYMVDERCVGLRYRSADGSKSGEKGCHFTLWNLDDIDEDTKYVIVLEGESDGLRAYQAIKSTDLPVKVLSTPTGMFPAVWAREFETCDKVILIAQADEASEKMLTAAKNTLKDKFDYIPLPWRRRQYGKDLCDWLQYNTEDELIARIEDKLTNVRRKFWSGVEFGEVANKPRDYVIGNLLARGEISMIAGPPKNKKTWFALGMAHAVITGQPLMGIPHFDDHPAGRVMIIEEEGDAESLYERAEMVFQDCPDWKERTLWGHHLGVRLDEDTWVKRLEQEIQQFQPDLLILDPFQRMHNKDENSASEMGEVWFNLHRIKRNNRFLAITLLHHFNKEGDINLGWNAMRGSSRNAAEADLGIFVQKAKAAGSDGCKVYIDGRTYRHVETPTGSDVWTFELTDRGLKYQEAVPEVTIGKKVGLLQYIFDKRLVSLADACKFTGLIPQSLRKSLASKGWDTLVRLESNGRGKTAEIRWIGPNTWDEVIQFAEAGKVKF